MNALEGLSAHRGLLVEQVQKEIGVIRDLLVRLEMTDNLDLQGLEDRLDHLENLRTKAGWMLSRKD